MPHAESTPVDAFPMETDNLPSCDVRLTSSTSASIPSVPDSFDMTPMEIDAVPTSSCELVGKQKRNEDGHSSDDDCIVLTDSPMKPSPSKKEVEAKTAPVAEIGLQNGILPETPERAVASSTRPAEATDEDTHNFEVLPFPGHSAVRIVSDFHSDAYLKVDDEKSWTTACQRLKLKKCSVKLKRDPNLDRAALSYEPPPTVRPAVVGPPSVLYNGSSTFRLITPGGLPLVTNQWRPSHPPMPNFRPQFRPRSSPIQPAVRTNAIPARPKVQLKTSNGNKGFYWERRQRLRKCGVRVTNCLAGFPPDFKRKLAEGKGSVKYHAFRRLTRDGSFCNGVYAQYSGRKEAEINYSWMGRTFSMTQRTGEEEALIPAGALVPTTQMIRTNRTIAPHGVAQAPFMVQPNQFVINGPSGSGVVSQSLSIRPSMQRVVQARTVAPPGLVVQRRVAPSVPQRSDHAYGVVRYARPVAPFNPRSAAPVTPRQALPRWYKEPEPFQRGPSVPSSSNSSLLRMSLNGSTSSGSSVPTGVPAQRGRIMIVPTSRLTGQVPAPAPAVAPPPRPKVVIHRVNGDAAFRADDAADDPLNDPLSDPLSAGPSVETAPAPSLPAISAPVPVDDADVICVE